MVNLETDYLVVGAGLASMAFVDTLISETDADVVMVDRRDQTGGHWNDAYDFVHLHAPASVYGVASRPLGGEQVDTAGFNAGHRRLAGKTEILEHFGQTMSQRFAGSGRVRWLSKQEYSVTLDGGHCLKSLVDGSMKTVTVRRRLVDGTRSNVQVPATHHPRFSVAEGVRMVPAGGLAELRRAPRRFCIIGAGKTAMDCCIWLMEHGVKPSRIQWLKPRDAWLVDRAMVSSFDALMQNFIGQLRAICDASSVGDLFERLERDGRLYRLDHHVTPTAFRCAILASKEIEMLRQIRDVIRMGHVQAIEPTRILLDQGELRAESDMLYVDCSAPGLNDDPPVPVFEQGRINLQVIRWCMPPFSMALIAFFECRYRDDDARNALARPVPLPARPADLLRMWQLSLANDGEAQKRPEIGEWSSRCRLNLLAALGGPRASDPNEPLLQTMSSLVPAAMSRLPFLIAEADAQA